MKEYVCTGKCSIPFKHLFKLEWQGHPTMWMREQCKNKALIKAVANIGEKGKPDYIGSFEMEFLRQYDQANKEFPEKMFGKVDFALKNNWKRSMSALTL